MSSHLSYSIRVLKGIGPKTAEVFESHGIQTIEDLLHFFPRGWSDATHVTLIQNLRVNQPALIDAQVATMRDGFSQRTRTPYLRATVADTSGGVDVMWFHSSYLKNKVKPGERFLLYGKVQGWQANERIIMSPKFITEPCILPIYPEIGGLTSAKIVQIFKQIEKYIDEIEDFLPDDVRQRHNVLTMAQTLRAMHFPQTLDDITQAKKRLGFNELLMVIYPTIKAQIERSGEVTASLQGEQSKVDAWIQALPFSLTGDQAVAVKEILADLVQTKPMNRLLQGDVGTGKTVVALAAAYQTILSGKRVAWLAPTELLALQHFQTAQKLLGNKQNLPIGLWTRTHHFVAKDGEEMKMKMEEVTSAPLVIGTHALLSEKIDLKDLGLLIIDEQHRFGVKQRAQLRTFPGSPVHLLSMTATPIPRTMALLLYGDLRLSTIKEKPSGRKPITTRIVETNNRPKAYTFVDAHIKNGGQVFVICPLIEPSKDDEANVMNQLFQTVEEKKAVTEWYVELKKEFPSHTVAMLHGKMKSDEKTIIMDDFRAGKIHILVSTTVIEVGVDVPNANIMMIENAERFGLAQLHQLRGRIGRGERQSFCLLFPSSDKKADNERLKIMEDSDDGFILAQKDLELRGPGELTGLAQSGLPALRYASLQDYQLVEQVKDTALSLMDNLLFTQAIDRFWRMYHPE